MEQDTPKAPKLRFKDSDGNIFSKWNKVKLNFFLEERNIQEPKSEKYPLMGFIANIGVAPKGDRYDREFLVKDSKNKKYKKTELNDFIYSSNNLDAGSIGLNKYGNSTISTVYSVFKIKENSVPGFVGRTLLTNRFINKMLRYRQGVVYGQYKIHEKEFLKIYIGMPSKEEQIKISNFFDTIDKYIENLKSQKEELEKYKKGMMQKIFSQQIRFKDENGNSFPEWEKYTLSNFLISNTERNKDTKYNLVLSVNNKKGFIRQSEQFEDREVASKNTSNYKIVRKNDYAYNPARINIGSIARLTNFEKGIVSPMYVCFKLNENLDINFFDFLLKTSEFSNFVNSSVSGSVRKTLNYDDLLKFETKIPCLQEQWLISEFLNNIDNLIKSFEHKISENENWKKGLMQEMFV